MSNPFNGSKHGKRGSRAGADVKRREADPDYEPKHKETTSGVVANGSANKRGESYSPAMFECAAMTESHRDYLIPRRSLTAKQGLQVFPEQVEFERLKDTERLQLDKLTGQLVGTKDLRYRVKWKSDRTLLRRNRPDSYGEGRGTRFTRITSQSKKRVLEIDIKTGPSADQVEADQPFTALAWNSQPEDILAEIDAIAEAAPKVDQADPLGLDALFASDTDLSSLINPSTE